MLLLVDLLLLVLILNFPFNLIWTELHSIVDNAEFIENFGIVFSFDCVRPQSLGEPKLG